MLCLLLLPIALAVGLLGGGSQALADDSPTGGDGSGSSEVSDRTRALDLWSTGGPEVRAAAEVALMGSDDDVRHFLDQTASDAAFQDERVSVAQLASVGGLSLQEAARKALEGTARDLKVFLAKGWQGPLFQDQRVQVAQIIDAGGPEVQKAGQAALNGTPDDVKAFLSTG
ncbi:ALF repeat-containing protein, partial [Streptomyces anandii]|uniref:ALF repeat-containing protein n=1 Tax=Streptomyces anandii TaxID=285454 RepID=UPI003701909C